MQLRKGNIGLAGSSRLQSIVARKWRRLELEAAGHTAYTKGRGMRLCALVSFSVLQSSGSKTQGRVPPTSRLGISVSSNTTKSVHPRSSLLYIIPHKDHVSR